MSANDPASREQLQLLAEELALELPDVRNALDAAARAAASNTRSCGISYRARYGVITVAASGQLAGSVDDFQYRGSAEGPCLEAMRTGVASWIDDMSTELRWMPYPTLAAAAGVRSSLSYPVTIDDAPVGALNLYSTQSGPWSADDDAEVIVLSHQIGGILRTMRGLAASVLFDRVSTEAFRRRHEMNVATGILMARHGLTDSAATEQILQTAAERGIHTREVVTEILAEKALKPPETPV